MAGAEDEIVSRDHVEHLEGLGQRRASIVDHRHGLAHEARPEEESSNATQTGTFSCAPALSSSCCSLTAETVGNHTMRAPCRAATSTASGFSPPTERLSVIVPSTTTPGPQRPRPAPARPSGSSVT